LRLDDDDPRLSMLEGFAKAMEMDVVNLLRALIGVVAGSIVLGAFLYFPCVIAGWQIAVISFGGGSLGEPAGVGMTAGAISAPLFGGLIGLGIALIVNRHVAQR
jgi:hypothetical protein